MSTLMRSIVFALSATLCATAWAQEFDYGSVIPSREEEMTYEDLLVHLAWEVFPENAAMEHRIAAAEKDLALAKRSWVDSLSFFMTFDDTTGQSADNFELDEFKIGIAFGLGFVNTGVKAKKARQEVEIARLNEKTQRLSSRAEILKRYATYRHESERLKIRTRIEEDTKTSYQAVSERFEDGAATFEELSEALREYQRAMEERFDAERGVLHARYDLEELVGWDLDEVNELYRRIGGSVPGSDGE